MLNLNNIKNIDETHSFIMLMSNFLLNVSNSDRRDMVPLEPIISHMAPAGYIFDNFARSIIASVCPARTRTPPCSYLSGKR